MLKSKTVRARIKPGLKIDVDKIFQSLGLSTTKAITLFYHQVSLNKGLPFDVKIPNKETQKVLADSRKGIGLSKKFDSVDDMFADLNSDA